MSKNKILSAAIVVALSTGVQAGEFQLLNKDGDAFTDDAPVYAYEQFLSSGDQQLDYQYYAEYTLGNAISADVYVTFTLSAGTWATALGSGNLKIYRGDSQREVSISIVDQGQTDQSSVQFLVAAATKDSSLAKDDKVRLEFKVGGVAGVLSEQGTSIKLDVAFATASGGTGIPDEPKSITVATSDNGATVLVRKDTSPGTVAIDVARGSTVFVNGIDDTTVSLGYVWISTGNKRKANGIDYWTFDASEGTLTINNGNFGASTTDSVYLNLVDPEEDYNAPPTTDSEGDIKADSVNGTEAIWKLTQDQLQHIDGKGEVEIIIKTDGTSEINTESEAPHATLVLKYSTDVVVSDKLRHIKRNGKVCKLYNIPNPDATDALSIRVTNKTGQTGLVLGTLTAMDATPLFTNKTLIAEFLPQSTVRLGIDELVAHLPEGTTTWAGRAVLQVNCNLTDVEVFGLLRNKAGGPLMNMSLDASGYACDD